MSKKRRRKNDQSRARAGSKTTKPSRRRRKKSKAKGVSHPTSSQSGAMIPYHRTDPRRIDSFETSAKTPRAFVGNAIRHALRQGQVGGWSSDHRAEMDNFVGWNFVSIHTMAKQAARANVSAHDDSQTAGDAKSMRHLNRQLHGTIFKGNYGPLESEPLPATHSLCQKLKQPNKWQSGASMRYEQIIQLGLTGTCMILMEKNTLGKVINRFIVPLPMTSPIRPSRLFPQGAVRISPQTVWSRYIDEEGFQEWGSLPYLAGETIPLEDFIIIRWPHALYRDDGQSPTSAGALWIDLASRMDRSRWAHMNSPDPSLLVEPPPDIDVSDQTEIDAYVKKLNAAYGGPENAGKIFVAAHQKVTVLSQGAKEMGYKDGFDQISKAIRALHNVPGSAVGIDDSTTYGALAASMQQFIFLGLQPTLSLIAEEETEQWAAPQYGKHICVDYEAASVNDPDLAERQINTDIMADAITIGEIRQRRGRKLFGDERDNMTPTEFKAWAQAKHSQQQQPGGGDPMQQLEAMGALGPPSAEDKKKEKEKDKRRKKPPKRSDVFPTNDRLAGLGDGGGNGKPNGKPASGKRTGDKELSFEAVNKRLAKSAKELASDLVSKLY